MKTEYVGEDYAVVQIERKDEVEGYKGAPFGDPSTPVEWIKSGSVLPRRTITWSNPVTTEDWWWVVTIHDYQRLTAEMVNEFGPVCP